MKTLFTTILVCAVVHVFAQIPSPGAQPKKAIVLVGAIAHIGNGEVLENAAIGIENGKITFIKPAGSVKLNPEEADIIEVPASMFTQVLSAPITRLELPRLMQFGLQTIMPKRVIITQKLER